MSNSDKRAGRHAAAEELMPQVYDALRRLAARYLRREGDYHTLQPTALVHEAYLRLAKQDPAAWEGKTHYLAIAAAQMRRVLVEHARAASARKRGGGRRRITLHDGLVPAEDATVEILAVNEALDRLASRRARQARVAEMRLFAGMSSRDIADTLGVSERTARDDWRLARARLAHLLGPSA